MRVILETLYTKIDTNLAFLATDTCVCKIDYSQVLHVKHAVLLRRAHVLNMTPITQSDCAVTQWSRWSRWHCAKKFRLKTFDMGRSDFLVSQLTFKSTPGTYCHPAVCLQVFKGKRSRSTFFISAMIMSFGCNIRFAIHVPPELCRWPNWGGTSDEWWFAHKKWWVHRWPSWLIAMVWGTPSDRQHVWSVVCSVVGSFCCSAQE